MSSAAVSVDMQSQSPPRSCSVTSGVCTVSPSSPRNLMFCFTQSSTAWISPAWSREGMFCTAMLAVQNIPSRDQAGEIQAVLDWVKQNIKFRGELGETVQTPLVTLQLRGGDCDCMSTLTAALLMALGYKVRFKTVAADPTAP